MVRTKPRQRVTTVAVCAMAAALTACGAGPKPSSQGRIKIAAAFYPWQFVAERVGGDQVSVTNLTKPGAEPHDLELTPRQVASLATAGLVIYEKGLQPAVDRAIDQQAKGRAFDTTTVAPLAVHPGVGSNNNRNDPLAGRDPHVWLDPILLRTIVREVGRRLGVIRPAEASTFVNNALRLEGELAALDTEIRAGLKTCASRVIVTSHTAFGYFADRYGLEQVGIAGLSPDTEPSTARIAAVSKLVTERGVSTIYYETLVSPAVAQSVAREAHVGYGVLDPIEGVSGSNDYLSVMRSNLTDLERGQRCT